jgi:hypothetical protein
MVDEFELTTNERGQLLLARPGREIATDVRIRRAFPWSSPDQHISIRSAEGNELMLIDDLQSLSSTQRQMIQLHLESASFIPRIGRVDEVDVRFGYQQWKVQTDRGPIEFRVQEREDIRFLPDGRFSLKDADGNIYELPALDQLDEHSRRQVEALV